MAGGGPRRRRRGGEASHPVPDRWKWLCSGSRIAPVNGRAVALDLARDSAAARSMLESAVRVKLAQRRQNRHAAPGRGRHRSPRFRPRCDAVTRSCSNADPSGCSASTLAEKFPRPQTRRFGRRARRDGAGRVGEDRRRRREPGPAPVVREHRPPRWWPCWHAWNAPASGSTRHS